MAIHQSYTRAMTLARASAESQTLKVVAEKTKLDYSWLHKFSQGKIPGASFDKVQRLLDYYAKNRKRRLPRRNPKAG